MTLKFHVRFDGRDASEHEIDLGQFGHSMIGLNKAVHEGLYVAVNGNIPKRGARLDIVVRAKPPHAGCVDLESVVVAASGFLPLLYEMLLNGGKEFLFHFLSFLLARLGGRGKEADPHFELMLEALHEMHDANLADRKDERAKHYESEAAWRDAFLALVDKLREPARNVVAPVGRTAEILTIVPPPGSRSPATVIDVPMADAIRSKEPLEVGEMERIRVKIDGITLHNRTIKIEDPQQPGRYINAEVRDPAFDLEPNIYKEAVGHELTLDVKPTKRLNGEIAKLYVMGAAPERNEAA